MQHCLIKKKNKNATKSNYSFLVYFEAKLRVCIVSSTSFQIKAGTREDSARMEQQQTLITPF